MNKTILPDNKLKLIWNTLKIYMKCSLRSKRFCTV